MIQEILKNRDLNTDHVESAWFALYFFGTLVVPKGEREKHKISLGICCMNSFNRLCEINIPCFFLYAMRFL